MKYEDILNNPENKKYLDQKILKDLNFSNQEIADHWKKIVEMYKIETLCKQRKESECATLDKYHIYPERNFLNRIGWKVISCPKCQAYEKKHEWKKNFLVYHYNKEAQDFKDFKTIDDDWDENKKNKYLSNLNSRLKVATIFDKDFNIKRNFNQQTNKPKNLGFYLYGKNGVGKTNIFLYMANYYAKNDQTVCFIHFDTLINRIKASFEDKEIYQEVENEKKLIVHCDVLFIDDLASKYVGSGWSLTDFLMDLLYQRYNAGKITFINSNYTLQELINILKFNNINKININQFEERIRAAIDNWFIQYDGESFRLKQEKND